MQYTQIRISTQSDEQSEIVVALLSDLPFEAFDEQEGLLSAYIPTSEYLLCGEQVTALLQQQGVEFEAIEVEQQNWNEQWESGFDPVEVDATPPIRIRAPHHTPSPEGVRDVVIAPRMSFGTGHHTTTALMSRTITRLDVKGRRGLDMGCGTGVLAIVALRCGAQSMVAVDIDDWACESCRDSIRLSGVEEQVEVRCGSIEVAMNEKYDFVLANINRNILQSMMSSFAELLVDGGECAMSGFLEEDIESVISSARSCSFDGISTFVEDGWAVVLCRKM